MQMIGLAICLPFASLIGTSVIAADSIEFPITVSAKSLSVAKPTSADASRPMRMAAQPEIPPTLPAGRLPQYQMKYRQRDLLSEKQRQTGVIWFQLIRGDSKLDVQATIRIDGKPFPQRRDAEVDLLAKAPVETSDDEKSTDDEPNKSAPLDAPYQNATTTTDLVRRYADATGEAITQVEAAWLMTNWDRGPELLLLNDPFQWYRSDQRPVVQILDRDQDGVLAKQEMEDAINSMERFDTNGDDVIDSFEIDAAGKSRVPSQEQGTDAQPFERRIKLLANEPPTIDLFLEINFQSESASESTLSITQMSPELQSQISDLETSEVAILFQLDSRPLEWSMVQDGSSDQVSIGAVVEGYPLLNAADPSADGRVTIRERRGLVDRLKAYDRDADGQLIPFETQATMRVCFGLGPIVHRELDSLRGRSPAEPETTAQPGPEWFARMDRNRDQDLSRSEFPGTDDQFSSLDFDNDDLISSQEALRFENQ